MVSFVGNPPTSASVPSTDPGGSTPDPVPGAGYYIAPTGSDTTGDGSITSPWLTIRKFANVAVAGSTLWCRGGSYTSVPRLILQNGDVSGIAGKPITVRAYPGETPSFVGAGSGSFSQFVMVTDGVSYWTFDGLTAQDFKTGSSGVFYVGRNVGLTVPTHHITIRNCTVTMVHEGGGPFNHPVYLSAYANNCSLEYNHLIGAQVAGSDGVGVNVGDHEPSPQGTLIQYNVFENFGSAGAIWWNGDLNTGSILHNTFLNPAVIYISLRYYASVTVRDNAGETASSTNISNVNDSGSGVATIDHNFFGQTFDGAYKLTAGQTGINAATDGFDAGAIDSGR